MNSWSRADTRIIDPTTKDYVIDDSGFQLTDSISQRMYLAICNVDWKNIKKKNQIDQSTMATISNALFTMIKSGEIVLNGIELDSSNANSVVVKIDYTNMVSNNRFVASL